jgi:predicted AAA+ superfamily ATPase
MYNRILKIPPHLPIILMGPRQTGKSTFLRNFLKNQKVFYVDLLVNEIYRRYEKDPDQLKDEILFKLKNEKITHVVIDEVQKVPDILNVIHALIEKKLSIQIILTGSSARKLKKVKANFLGGRAILLKMFPFTYGEIENDFQLDSFLQFGSICGIFDGLSEDKETKILKLKSYYETYVKDEVLSEGLIRQLPPFHRFLDLTAHLATEIVSFANIAREAHVAENTIKNYYQILEETYLGFFLPAYDVALKRSLSLHPKFYFFDNGLNNCMAERLRDPLSPEIKGKLFEQWIINEVRMYLSYHNKEGTLYFWRTQGGHEVDLIYSKGHKLKLAIEIKFKKNLERKDFSGLNKIKEDYPKLECILIYNGPNSYEDENNNVVVLPWKEFLTERLKLL